MSGDPADQTQGDKNDAQLDEQIGYIRIRHL
jgi:hypothetical protein